jgi:hypothetical protein
VLKVANIVFSIFVDLKTFYYQCFFLIIIYICLIDNVRGLTLDHVKQVLNNIVKKTNSKQNT